MYHTISRRRAEGPGGQGEADQDPDDPEEIGVQLEGSRGNRLRNCVYVGCYYF